ncbi:MAG: acetyl-CoA carboxylase biotin carboxylase subunit [Eubacteriales bacterium]|nr:acetyl-CoA carboxylase biotin carboxylase subunit [Clostridiales bacterium]
MYSKILIANRGEIAVRIIRACKEMGIDSVAVYSQADAGTLHVALADESYCIGKPEAADSYLNPERIIGAALASGAQAIHPGYGFLSENREFAALCRKYGIAFIGPPAETMEKLGDKASVKRAMAEAGLAVIPGTGPLESAEDAAREAERLGYPVMLKSCLGGGGRGIRHVQSQSELAQAFAAAKAEATAAFGSCSIYMEKFIHPARHIEIQVLADEYGNVVCLGDRDCSIQQKRQKLVEESPSPAVTDEQRAEIFERVREAVRKIDYHGAGTLEFLYDGKNFYFMEMNVRLQVEHTVTESLTGIDIVKWQIRIASGVPLSFTQDDVDLRGSSIECRILARQPGKVEFLHVPGGPFVRFDTYLTVGTQITPHYDPLIGKLIIYSGSREESLRKIRAALCELVIDGVQTNIEEQLEIVSSKEFSSGSYNLDFLSGR